MARRSAGPALSPPRPVARRLPAAALLLLVAVAGFGGLIAPSRAQAGPSLPPSTLDAAKPAPPQPPSTSAPSAASAAAMEEARRLLASGDRAGAIAVLEPLAERPAAPLPAVSLLAGLYVEAGRAEEALTLIEPRLEGAGPEGAELLFVAARAARALERNEQAEAYLERSAAAAPLSRAAILLATLRSQQDRHAEAEALLAPIVAAGPFAIAARQDPVFASEIALHYARTLLALDRPADAVLHLRRAAELRPDDAEVRNLLAETLVEVDRVEEARAALEEARALEEAERQRALRRGERRAEAQALVEEAAGLQAAGRLEDALDLVRRAAEIAPEEPLSATLEVRLLVALDRGDEALAAARALVERFPGVPEAHHLLGTSRLAFGDPAGAETAFRNVLALVPDHQGAFTSLTLALIRMGRLVEADEVLDQVLERWPDDPVAQRARDQLDALLGGAAPDGR